MASTDADVFLAVCDPEHFEQTVVTPIAMSEYPDHPTDLDGEVRLWRVTAGDQNRSHFEKMDAGDVVLFYCDGAFVGTGLVDETLEDDDGWASETFWDGTSAPMLYTVRDFAAVSVPRAAVNRIFEYSESYTPHGLLRVAESRLTNDPQAIKLAVERYDDKH